MENKYVGWLIIGIAVVMIIIVWIFNLALKKIVSGTCTMAVCPMYDTITVQTWISLAIVVVIIVIGLVVMFSKPREKIIIKKVREKIEKKQINLNSLDKEEKTILKIIQDSQGTIFQSDIVDKIGFSKVKVTRILDRLEGKQLIERKRRGMTNIVILKG